MLSEWLAYISTLHPFRIDLGLQRVKVIAEELGLTSFICPVITVAGTNGKGSCVKFLESIYQAAGYCVGTYTSPHLIRFNERIRIGGNDVNDGELISAFRCIENARLGRGLSYFEFTTLAALYLFQQYSIDVIVLEVGLGGRLDAVNVVESDVFVITSVGLDHMDWLGPDRESIGREKAGIFRASKPAVCGDVDSPESVRQVAAEVGAPLYCLADDYRYEINETAWSWFAPSCRFLGLPKPRLKIQNAATVLKVLELLQNRLPVSIQALHRGLSQAALMGRFESMMLPMNTIQAEDHNPLHCIIDVAHNPPAAEWLACQLQAIPSVGRRFAVVGMLGDKSIAQTLAPLLEVVDEWYLADITEERGADADEIASHLRCLGVKSCYTFASVEQALSAAIERCCGADQLIVFGSFVTVGSTHQFFEKNLKEYG